MLSTRLRRGCTNALRRLHAKRYTDLVAALIDAAHDPQLTDAARQPCDQALPAALEPSWKLLAKRAKELGDDSPAEDWHEVRKCAKRTRYATDLAATILKDETKKPAKAMNAVTDVLGDLQDAHVAQGTLAEIAQSRRVDGAAAYALGLLGERQAEREAQLRTAFGPAWSKAAKQHRRVRQST